MNPIKYIQLKPAPEKVLEHLPWTGRKRPYILVTFEDGSTKSLTVKHVDLRTDPKRALAVAEKVLRKMQGDLALDRFSLDEYFPKKSVLTLGALRDIFLEHREKEINRGKISQNTYQSDINFTKLFVDMLGRDTLIARIDVDVIQEFIDTLLEKPTHYGEPYKPSTINTHLKNMRTMYSFAVKRGLVKNNPFMGYPFLETDERPRFLTEDAEHLFRAHLEQDSSSWHRDFFDFALATGMRRSEIIDANLNRIKQERIDGKLKRFIRVIGKGTRRFREVSRWVPLDDALEIVDRRKEILADKRQLNAILANSKGEWEKVHRERAAAGYLFFEISSINSVNAFFREVRKRCNLDDSITIHSLRHTFAVRALESRRLDIYGLSRVMGHTDVKTTQIYLSATPKIISMYQ